MSASVTLLCPNCEAMLVARDESPVCDACSAHVSLRSNTPFKDPTISDCAVCGSEALYVAKDFNKNVGVLMVLLGCIGFYWGALAGVSTLVAMTILDRIVYRLRPMVTVCYACKSVYRQLDLNPVHKGYELTFDETFEGTGETPSFEPPATST